MQPKGIGRAIVASLRTAGAEVGAIDIDAETLDQLPAEIGRFTADLGRRDDAHASIDAVHARYGRLDGLVTAAGGVRGQAGRSIQEITEQDWRVIFEANVDGAMWCAQAAVPHVQQAGSGRIVTISSGAGLRPSLTGIQAYASAKHALVGLTRQLALELGPKGITVNSVAPGFILSNPSTERQWQAFGPERQAQVLQGIHMRRLGTPKDIANAVTFLVAPQSDWISGQILSVDGGHS